MTTRVATDSGISSSGTTTLSAMSITGSNRKFVGMAVGTNDASWTMDSAQLGGVNLIEMSVSPVDAVNCRTRGYYLDEASFPGGSTADAVFDTNQNASALESAAAGVYNDVASGDSSPAADTYTSNNNDDYVLAITPGTADGLVVSLAGRQIQSGDAHTATGNLTEQQEQNTNFVAGLAFSDELDPPASSRDGSGDWGTNMRDNACIMVAFEGASGGGGRIMSSLVGAGGLAGAGGIVGAGGGLAGAPLGIYARDRIRRSTMRTAA